MNKNLKTLAAERTLKSRFEYLKRRSAKELRLRKTLSSQLKAEVRRADKAEKSLRNIGSAYKRYWREWRDKRENRGGVFRANELFVELVFKEMGWPVPWPMPKKRKK